jgi:hypothetical protein
MVALRTVVLALSVMAQTSAYNNGYGMKPFLGWQSWCAVGKCGTDACYDRQVSTLAPLAASRRSIMHVPCTRAISTHHPHISTSTWNPAPLTRFTSHFRHFRTGRSGRQQTQ